MKETKLSVARQAVQKIVALAQTAIDNLEGQNSIDAATLKTSAENLLASVISSQVNL